MPLPQVSCQKTVCTCIPHALPISLFYFDHLNSTAYVILKDWAKSEALCCFMFLWPGGVITSPNLPCWRITAYWLFMTIYSIFTAALCICRLSPPAAMWWRVMPWWQWPTCITPYTSSSIYPRHWIQASLPWRKIPGETYFYSIISCNKFMDRE